MSNSEGAAAWWWGGVDAGLGEFCGVEVCDFFWDVEVELIGVVGYGFAVACCCGVATTIGGAGCLVLVSAWAYCGLCLSHVTVHRIGLGVARFLVVSWCEAIINDGELTFFINVGDQFFKSLF